MLQHLVISEKDFLVWDLFAVEPRYYMSHIFGGDWLKFLSRGMHLRKVIAVTTFEIGEPLSLLSTLEKNVLFGRNYSRYTVV